MSNLRSSNSCHIIRGLTLILVLLTIVSGCSTSRLTVNHAYQYQPSDHFSYRITQQAPVPEKALRIFRQFLDKKIAQLNAPTAKANREIEIIFRYYQMRNGAVRALSGALSGPDTISTGIVIYDKTNGQILADFHVISNNPSIGNSAKGLIEDHIDKILDYLHTGQS